MSAIVILRPGDEGLKGMCRAGVGGERERERETNPLTFVSFFFTDNSGRL